MIFNPYATILVANDFNKYYKNATQYVVRLQDIYGNPISGYECCYFVLMV